MGCFCVFTILLGRLLSAGVNLSLIVPLLSAGAPLGSIAVATLAYGEPASLAKIATLIVACLLIGAANLL